MLTRFLFLCSATVLAAAITCPHTYCAYQNAVCVPPAGLVCGPHNDGTAGAAVWICDGNTPVNFVELAPCGSGQACHQYTSSSAGCA
ncbi:hypothetical protein DFH09DRAFT_1171446 [Mycena vulgaris]|nr:hypothetical protein DFH09DRAFT_1171446 [Mycena vulgaris]